MLRKLMLSYDLLTLFHLCRVVLKNLSLSLNNDEKVITKRYCVNNNKFNLLIRKGVFPYTYIDNLGKLEEENQFPLKEALFCKLNTSSICNEDFQHACRV